MTTPSTPGGSNRLTYSCVRCADRKVKCDRQRPCSACVKHNVECIFRPSRPPEKRKKRVKVQALTDRLKLYESLLQEQGISLSNATSSLHIEANPTAGATPQPSQSQPLPAGVRPDDNISKRQIVNSDGRSKFVDNSLWSRLVEELHDIKEILEDSSQDTSEVDTSDHDDDAFVLSSPASSSIGPDHPPAQRIFQLWQIFVENVDPLTKILHAPTVQPAIQRAMGNTKAIPRGFEALMFAIYSAAVMSLRDDDCRQQLGEPREALLSRYLSGTKRALSRAKFMSTISFVVLQALVLHIIVIRDIYEPRAVWSLNGIAVRIAQSMGLERDGSFLNLSPFETEMRRRVWWLLKSHDFRTAELCGLSKFRDLDFGAESTKGPTNLNDNQLYPGMPVTPAESGMTDMIFLALRYEFISFAAERVNSLRQKEEDASKWNLHISGSERTATQEAFKKVEETLETKYLRYCDPSQPLQLMTMVIARHFLDVVRFLTHHPRRWTSIGQTPASERQWVWQLSLRLLEQHNMILSNPQLRKFSWHAPNFIQWHSFIHLLDSLQANPQISEADRAWQLIGSTYENTPAMIFDTKKAIHVAVGNLCLKAYAAREAAMSGVLLQTPEFILQLRRQREVARAKAQTRAAKNKAMRDLSDANMGSAKDIGVWSPPQQEYTPQSLPPEGVQSRIASIEDDSFWLANGFDDSLSGDTHMHNIEPDYLLTQDGSFEGYAPQAIAWEQWDAWLADSNLTRSSDQ